MVVINYPDVTFNINGGLTQTNVLSPTQIIMTDVSNNTTLSSVSLSITKPEGVIIIEPSSINSNFTDSSQYFINQTQLSLVDASGITQSLTRSDGLITQDISGNTIQLSYSTGLKINNDEGTSGQILSKDVSNNMTWSDPTQINPIVSTIQYFISQTNPLFQYPPTQPPANIINTYGYYGWYFINSVALQKIHWFFAPDYAMVVADVKGLYMNYFNITTTTNEELPFISIYTKPTGSGDIIPGFAHSSATYIANFNPTANTPFCSFMNITGTQPDPFPYGHNLGTMIQNPTNNPRGEYLPTEEVLAIAVSTNSTAVLNQVNFVMSKVGICLAQGNQENILNPQDIAIPTLSQVLTSGSVASNQNVSGVATLTATKLVTPTIDNSENTITIGANTTGLTLGKLATTTNIQGNLQIAGSAGSNAQVLTSNGTTAEWQTPSGGWVGVATSNLSMGNNKILVGDGTDLNVDISNNGFKLYNQSTLSVDIGFESVTTYRNGNPTKIAQISADVGLYCFNGLDAKGIQVSNTDILIDNVAGSANQVLSKDASNVLTWATPSGGGGSWVGTATSDLNMSSFNITSTSALSVGNTGVATKLIGDVDISNNLTYGNGALRVYGATSVDTTAVSINIGTAYPNRNADFTLILTGTTASQVLTFPTAVAGYKITIYNKSNKNWTLNCAGTDLFYGNGNDPPGGLLTYRNGIPGGKCLTFFQQPSSYYLINESCSTTETYFGKLYANNNANVPINLLGNQEQLFATTTPYTMPIFANTMVSSFLVCSALSSVVYLQTFATLASLVTGYVIIIRNNTLLPITIQGNANPAVIYATGSITSAATFILPSTMTCSIKAISNQGYFVFSMY